MSSDPSLDTHQYRRQQLKHHPSHGTFSSADMDGSGGGGEEEDEESFSAFHARRFGGNYHYDDDEDERHPHHHDDLAYENAEEEDEMRGSGRGKFNTAIPHDSLWFENSPSRNKDDDDDDDHDIHGDVKESGDSEGGRRSKRSSAAFATPQSSSPHSMRQGQTGSAMRISATSDGNAVSVEDTASNASRYLQAGGNGEISGSISQAPFDYTSSESEDDRARFGQHQYRHLSSGSTFTGTGGRPRRDSGLPPIQLTAAKRLPHYPSLSAPSSTNPTLSTETTLTAQGGTINKSSSATSLVSTPMAIEEEEEEEEDDDVDLQQQRLRRQLQEQYSNDHLNRQHQRPYQGEQSEDMDSEDIVESLEIREREMPTILTRSPNLQVPAPAKQNSSISSNSATKKPPVVVYSEPQDRGPADLSNPSFALAEALIAARAQAESRKNAVAGATSSQGSSSGSSGTAGSGTGGAAAGATANIARQTLSSTDPTSSSQKTTAAPPTSKDRLLQQQQQQAKFLGAHSMPTTSAPSTTQVKIPVPHLSPMMRGQQTLWEQQQQQLSAGGGAIDPAQASSSHPGRSPESLRPFATAHRTSFTLSPTSSNPELGHSQTDSHSGESLMAAHIGGRSSGQDYRQSHHQDSQLGSSYDSNRYDRGGAHHQPRRHHSPSYSSASSPPTHHHHHHHHHSSHQGHSRYLFPGRDLDQQSMEEEEELPHYDHPTRRSSGQHHHFREPSRHSRYESSINDEMDDPFRPRHRPSLPRQHQLLHHQASASEVSAYPLSASSRSMEEESHDGHRHRHNLDETEEDDEDAATTSSAAAHRMAEDEQLRAETEYIMSRNAELLKILAIRDDEIQTLQQELDHTLKVMHEYENDLMEMHTAAAQPYESYHQTLDEIGREMTQQDALLKGYKEENEKLAGRCRSLVDIRNEAEKRHLEKVEELKAEIERLQTMLNDSVRQQPTLSSPSTAAGEGGGGGGGDDEKQPLSVDSVSDPSKAAAAIARLEALREQERSSYLDKEESYLAEIAMLKERVAMLEQVLDDEKRNKVQDMQRLERNFQDVRDGYDGMVEQIKSLGVNVPLSPLAADATLPPANATATSAVYTVSERPLLLHRESSSDEASSAVSNNGRVGDNRRGSTSSSQHHSTPPLPPQETSSKLHNQARPRGPDRKLTSTEKLTTSNMPKVMAELGLDQRISRFEADIRQSLMRSSSMDSFASVQSSSNASINPAATTTALAATSSANPLGGSSTTIPSVHVGSTTTAPTSVAVSSSSTSHQPSREELRPSSASLAESQVLANKLRDRINVLNAENQRLHQELATLSNAMKQQQAERQRKVKQLEDLLDLHESVAEKKLTEDRVTSTIAAPGGDEKNKKDSISSSDPSTLEGQQRIRKIIQGLLVRIRTKEAEAEFYHNAYLDKVLELDQMALKAGKGFLFSPVQGPVTSSAATATTGDPMAATAGTPVSPLPPSSALTEQTALLQQQQQINQHQKVQIQQQQQTIEALENRVMELEQANLELTIRLQVEQRRAQARESENMALTREKLVLARLLEDQIEELKSKLASTELAHQKLLEENATLRERGAKDAAAAAAAAKAAATQPTNEAQEEQLAIMRARMSSLTRQRDQLREQLQEALDIQLTMQESGSGAALKQGAGGVPAAGGGSVTRAEWTVDDYRRLEKALEEKTTELCLWKERAVALEKVVERIRMIKVKPDVFGHSSTSTASSAASQLSSSERRERTNGHDSETGGSISSVSVASSASNADRQHRRRSHGGSKHHQQYHQRSPLSHSLEELDQIVLKLEQRLERRDQELREVVAEAKRQTDMRLEQWKAKWVQVVQRKNAEIHRFQIELESLMKAVERDRQRMMAQQQHQDGTHNSTSGGKSAFTTATGGPTGSKHRAGSGMGSGMHLSSHQGDYDDDHDLDS